MREEVFEEAHFFTKGATFCKELISSLQGINRDFLKVSEEKKFCFQNKFSDIHKYIERKEKNSEKNYPTDSKNWLKRFEVLQCYYVRG